MVVFSFLHPAISHFATNSHKLEQLERLRSEIPPAAPWLTILVIHIRSQVKTRQSQRYKFLKIAKNTNFEILHETLHATHLLKLLDKMYKYEMDPTKPVGATERTRGAGRTDGQTDGRTDGVKPVYPPATSLCGGYKKTPNKRIFFCCCSKSGGWSVLSYCQLIVLWKHHPNNTKQKCVGYIRLNTQCGLGHLVSIDKDNWYWYIFSQTKP